MANDNPYSAAGAGKKSAKSGSGRNAGKTAGKNAMQSAASPKLRPSWPKSPADYTVLLVDDPAPHVRRLTMNRPDKRNALNHDLRAQILHALRAADQDPDVHVMIVRGAGPSFSAGYDLGGGNDGVEYPFFTPGGEGQYPRHVTETWMSIWELSKPVIAQVHGYCLAGGSELATGCDVVYMAEDAKMGYPAGRFGVPDMQFHAWLVGMRRGMEMMLTGDPIDGIEAVQRGWATRAYPADQLEAKTLEMAQRIASLPPDIVALNKRAVHRQMVPVDREEVVYTLHTIRHAINLKIRQEHVEDRMWEARAIQLSLLPRSAPDFGPFDIAGASQPAEEVGGDLYDFLPISPKRIGLAIADASGHGLPAALQACDAIIGL